MDTIETLELETIREEEAEAGWTRVCDLRDLSAGSGTCARIGGAQVAVFRISDDEFRAAQNVCPHSGAPVLHQGLVGDHGGAPKVTCPLHKRSYSLEDGRNLSGEGGRIRTWPVRVQDGAVWVGSR